MALSRTFFLSASTLMTGTVVAQAITFGLSFVVTRLYAPSEFGKYSIYIGVAGVLGLLATGALDKAIMLSRSEQEARRAATAVIVVALCAAFGVALIGIALWLTGIIARLPLGPVEAIVFLPIFMLCFAAAQVLTYSSLREQKSRHLAALKVGQSLTAGLVQVAAAGLGAVGLIVGNLAGWLVLAIGGVQWRLRQRLFRPDLRKRSLRALVGRHWRYPRYVLPNELLDALSNQVPILFIGAFVTLEAAGHYGLAMTVLAAPAALLGQAVGQAFLQFVSPVRLEPRAIEKGVWQIWLAMACAGIVPFGLLVVAGPELFAYGFGGEWGEAGIISRFMAPLIFMRFVSSPTSTLYWKLGMQREQWWFSLAAASYRCAAFSLLLLGADLLTTIKIHVAVECTAIAVFNAVALSRLRALRSEQTARGA